MRSLSNRLSRTERVLLVTTLGLLIGLGLISVLATRGTRRYTDQHKHRASSFFTDETGTRGLYLALQQLVPGVARWHRPPSSLPSPAEPDMPTTLLLFSPSQPLSPAQADALDAWIAQGGQVVLAAHHDWPMTTAMSSTAQKTQPTPTADEGYLRRHGWRIQTLAETVTEPDVALTVAPYALAWDESASQESLVITPAGHSIAGSKPLGRGRLVVVSDGEAFSNRRLRESRNAVWLVTLCATWGNGRVLIDEFYHGFGQRRALLHVLGHFLLTPWGWVCLQATLAGVLYLAGPLRRFGQLADPSSPPRQSPVELLAWRGSLLAAAQARSLAADLIHHYLQYRLSATLGSTVNIDETPIQARLAARSAAAAHHLERYRQLAQRTFLQGELSDRTLLDLGRGAALLSQEVRRT